MCVKFRLRLIRNEAGKMIARLNLPVDLVGDAYRKPNAIDLCRSHQSLFTQHFEDPFCWISLIEKCWTSFSITRTAMIESLDFRNYSSEWIKDLPPHIYLAKHLSSFSSATHFFFTGKIHNRTYLFFLLH